MQFVLSICHDESFRATPELITAIYAWVERMDTAGVRLGGWPLRPIEEVQTVRVREGEFHVTSGLAAPSECPMTAIQVIEADNMDAAVEIAASYPMASVAAVEVRPVWETI